LCSREKEVVFSVAKNFRLYEELYVYTTLIGKGLKDKIEQEEL
jgi:hypothetical protein